MKKVVVFIFIVLVTVVLVVLGKTFVYPFAKIESTDAVSQVNYTVSEEALLRLSGGLRIPTISEENYEETNFAAFDAFKDYLTGVYPEIYEAMDTMTVNTYGLLFRWKGKNTDAKPLLFLSHYDVVPVIGFNPETDTSVIDSVFQPNDKPVEPIQAIPDKWDYHPFSGAVANGRIYGRGSLDMKGMLFAIMESATELLAEGWQPEQDIWFAFGQDEERSGLHGAVKMAQYFKGLGIEFAAVYDEGGIITAPGTALEAVKKPMALVGLGEKGFLSLRIKVHGLGGHSSMPPQKSSLVYAAEIIEKLNSNQMPPRMIDPVASFLNNIGGEMSFVSRMAIANQWLLQPVLFKSLEKSPASNALIRTTTAITMAKGSDASNVITSVAEVVVNFRLLAGDSVEDVMKHVEDICVGYDTEIEVISAREASGLTPSETEGLEKIREVITQLYPDAIVSSYITVAATDAYKYHSVSKNVYRIMPVLLNQYEQRIIHSENEYLSIDNYGNMIFFFKSLMRN